MNALVSICIPTYQRPELLRQAIVSCLVQTYSDIEIIVCDDSKDDASEQMVNSLNEEKIRYYRNQPSLGQAGNVNRLFDLAQGDRLVLLHDDDLLLPDAVQAMSDCWATQPQLGACFGKQYIINMAGEILQTQSQDLNRDYYRTEQYTGLQVSTRWSALVAQFPNDGYMLLTHVARMIRYRNTPDVGDACDFDFGLRLASTSPPFFFLNQYTAKYRLTEKSISSGDNHSDLVYRLIEALELPEELESIRSERLKQAAPSAINRWLTIGDKASAYRVYRSAHYPWSKRLAPKGLIQAVLLACPTPLNSAFVGWLRHKKLSASRV
ncbi:glycosyltransferase family 2 protein [Phormidesmis priestleyi]